jgi:hypothetical protein
LAATNFPTVVFPEAMNPIRRIGASAPGIRGELSSELGDVRGPPPPKAQTRPGYQRRQRAGVRQPRAGVRQPLPGVRFFALP